MARKTEILDAALDVLRNGGTLTIDAVAAGSGLTKPGVVHHFATKEVLALAVLDHMADRWEEKLAGRAGRDAGPVGLLRAYVEHALLADMDAADLALLADPRLRDPLSARWAERTRAWFGDVRDPRLVAARLVADGAWIDRCLGLLELGESERAAAADLATSLVDQAVAS